MFDFGQVALPWQCSIIFLPLSSLFCLTWSASGLLSPYGSVSPAQLTPIAPSKTNHFVVEYVKTISDSGVFNNSSYAGFICPQCNRHTAITLKSKGEFL